LFADHYSPYTGQHARGTTHRHCDSARLVRGAVLAVNSCHHTVYAFLSRLSIWATLVLGRRVVHRGRIKQRTADYADAADILDDHRRNPRFIIIS
jgi:hypothetical protein